MEAFRAHLEEWMARTGTSQAALGRRSGIAQNVISQWLGSVERRPSDANLRKLAPIIGTDYEDLLRMCGYLPGEPKLANLDPELAALLAEIEAGWHAMDETERPVAKRGALALFGVPPVQRPSIGRRRRVSIRPEGEIRERDRDRRDTTENGSEGPLADDYANPAQRFLSLFRRVAAPSFSLG